jgi:hypothetical protein
MAWRLLGTLAIHDGSGRARLCAFTPICCGCESGNADAGNRFWASGIGHLARLTCFGCPSQKDDGGLGTGRQRRSGVLRFIIFTTIVNSVHLSYCSSASMSS